MVRGSAVNQDGATNGLTAPNGPSQQRVILQALANAGLSPADVDAVEAHGTGTALGDPIEAQALLATYGQERSNGPLRLGSIKSNIGHTQAAAGVAGVIKMVEALRHGVLPKTLHVDEPTPHVDWESGAVELLTDAVEWPAGDRPRRAGVSSFGISGTNVHAILEEAPAPVAADGAPGELVEGGAGAVEGGAGAVEGAAVVPWLLSARSELGLRAQAVRLADHVGGDPGVASVDVGWSLVSGRARLEHRAVVVGSGRDGLLAGVGAVAGGVPGDGVVGGVAGGDGRVAMVFSGQGQQWPGMAVGLLDESPVFAGRFVECGVALAPFVDWSLEGVLRGESEEWLSRFDLLQPVLWAVMVSLAEVWRSFGVVPSVVTGHSQGEIAAACVAGGLSLEDGARIVALRSRALLAIAGQGGMVSLPLGLAEVEGLIEPFGERLSIAAVNSSRSVGVSGDIDAVEELQARCEADGIGVRRVAVDCASHSAHMDVVRDELLEGLVGIEPRSSTVPFVSGVTGEIVDTGDLDAEYWFGNLRNTVRFDLAAATLLGLGYRSVVEVSGHPTLTFAVEQLAEETLDDPGSVAAFGTLRRDEGGIERFMTSLAQAWVRGVAVDWQPAFAASNPKRVPLPTYAFQRDRYWLEPGPTVGDLTAAGQRSADHPLLGATIALAREDEWLFTGRISFDTHPWLADHVAFDTPLLPGTAFVELALRAASELNCDTIEELTLAAPLILPAEGGVRIQVAVGARDEAGRRTIDVHSRPDADREAGEVDLDGEWTLHASGLLSDGATPDADRAVQALAGTPWPPPDATAVELDGLYDGVASVGYEYGPAFQGLRAAWQRGDEVFGEVDLADEQLAEAERFGIHPALLDAVMHTAFVQRAESGGAPQLPFSWRGVRLHAPGSTSLRVRVAASEAGLAIAAVDTEGLPVASVELLATRAIAGSQFDAAASAGRDALFGLDWVAAPASDSGGREAASPLRVATLAVDEPGLLAALEARQTEVAAHADIDSLIASLGDEAEPPDVVLAGVPAGAGEDPVAAARAASARVLGMLQALVSEERLAGTRLTFVTRGAVGASADGPPLDIALGAIWGLVRSAKSEHPGRFALVDVDGDDASWAALAEVLGRAEEPEIALRSGELLVPRLARVQAPADPQEDADGQPLDPEGTVLVTGGVSGIGALVARHLASEHGARHLLLTSRRGIETPGAAELVAELSELGCEVRVEACDVSERAQVEALLDSIASSRPLTAVVHSAAVLDDATIGSLTPERIDAVMAPKVDAAWHLHELTADLDLAQFVLFSSVAATLGGPGQGNYAAANAFLDALAVRRRADGLPATSIAWGLWEQTSELTAELRESDLARMSGMGFTPLGSEDGLALFDRARASALALLVATPLDLAALRQLARADLLPSVFGGLVRLPARRADSASASALARKLAEVSDDERPGVVSELVREHAAAVLGHSSGAGIDPQAAFKDLGFDSLTAVELRNRLGQATGLRLPATLVFDYPTPDGGRQPPAVEGPGACRSALRGGRGARRREPRRADRDRRHELPLPRRRIARRGPLGAGRVRRATRSPASRPTAAGTWSASTTRIPTAPAPPTHARAASSTTPASSTPRSSASARARRSRSTRSSACCSRPPGRRSSTPGSTRARCAASRTGVFAGVMFHDYGMSGTSMPPELEGYCGDRRGGQRRLRPDRLHARARGPGRHGRHRVLVLARGAAPRVPGAAPGEMLAGAGRRRDRPGDPGRVRRVQPPARAGRRRPLQGVRRRRRRHRLVRGRRPAAARAPLRRAPQRPPRCWRSCAAARSTRTAPATA